MFKNSLISMGAVFFVISASAQTTGTNTMIHNQEAIEKQKERDRVESANTSQALKPNERNSPTKVDASSWGLNSNVVFNITNHLLGYSVINEKDQTLSGVKLTGLINFAVYKSDKTTATGRSKVRYIFGLEEPLFDLTNRTQVWGGMGLLMGDGFGFYVDAGIEYHFCRWFKIQAGFNGNTKTGVNPQGSLGLTW